LINVWYTRLIYFVQVVTDYYTIIQRPMDLQTVREHLRAKKYQNREDFLSDVHQIVENSTLYNGT
jgi:transcription initiation factor TFIID subunit 1